MDAGAQNEEPTFDEALVMELLSRAAAEGGGQRAAANIKLTAGRQDLRRAAAAVCAEGRDRAEAEARSEGDETIRPSTGAAPWLLADFSRPSVRPPRRPLYGAPTTKCRVGAWWLACSISSVLQAAASPAIRTQKSAVLALIHPNTQVHHWHSIQLCTAHSDGTGRRRATG